MAAVDPGARTDGSVARQATARAKAAPEFPYLNRELSWLEFNGRVLHEARDERNPLLERAKFLAIFAGNLDEFFQVRIAGLRQQVAAGAVKRSPDGRTPAEQLQAARERILELVADHSAIFLDLRRELADAEVEVVDYAAIPEHHDELRQRFLEEIYPVLTPLAVDPGHPFPYISTLSLSIAVGLRDPDTHERVFARVKVPQILPRLLEVEPAHFVPIDQVIEANLADLFMGMEVIESHLFRVTRNADFDIEEDEADDLLMAIEEELRRRRFGEAVRLEVERAVLAVGAQAVHRDVRDVGAEPEVVLEARDELGGDLRRHAQDLGAPVAHEVDVHVLVDGVVRGRAVADVRVGDQPDVLQHLQGAVHRGEVHARRGALHLDEDLLRSAVPQ